MNSIKIEKSGISFLKNMIRLHTLMDEFLQDNDKEPSWDGDIILYSNADLKVENILYRVPTQVKSKNDENLLNRKMITYPVEYKHLRNYFNDNGVCYFVIIISNNGKKAAIFYNTLTPIKLQSLLEGKENKKPDQTKNIPLNRLKDNDEKELFKILWQFGYERSEQGAKEIVKKSIAYDDLEKIDSISVTTIVTDPEEILQNITTGEICLFGHMADSGIWLPFKYETQLNMEHFRCEIFHKTFGIDGVPFYDCFKMKKSNKNMFIQLSDNLKINIEDNTISFIPLSELPQIMDDLKFLASIQNGKYFSVDDKPVCFYGAMQLEKSVQNAIKVFKQLNDAVTEFKICIEKRWDELTEIDVNALNELVKIYIGRIIPKTGVYAWHMWWWQGKVVPFFIAVNDKGKVSVENGMHFKYFRIAIIGENTEYDVPAFMLFKKDVWEKLYDVKKNFMLEAVKKYEINAITKTGYERLMLDILSAYDTTKNENYYDVAVVIIDRLLDFDPYDNYSKVNRLQLIKRKRSLSKDELLELEYIEENADEKKLLCGINILLENKRKAEKILDSLSEKDREVFMTYPIYNLLKI